MKFKMTLVQVLWIEKTPLCFFETIQAMEREIDALRKREKELKEDLYSTHRELKFQTATVITDEKLKSELYDLK